MSRLRSPTIMAPVLGLKTFDGTTSVQIFQLSNKDGYKL